MRQENRSWSKVLRKPSVNVPIHQTHSIVATRMRSSYKNYNSWCLLLRALGDQAAIAQYRYSYRYLGTRLGASKSPFQTYKSKPNLSFANLICSSVSGPKALKIVSAFCHTQLQWKVMERFWYSIREMWSVCTKIALIEKTFRSQTRFCCLHVYLPTSTVKMWGQSDKFPMSFTFLQCPL